VPDVEDWLIFAALAASAAVAQRLLIPVGRHHGFPMAVVFLVAAALLLPPELVALMGLAQHLPDIAGRRFPAYITAFNVSNYTLSTLAAWGAARLIGTTGLEADLRWASAGVAAALVLVVVNHTGLAVMLRLARGRSFRSTGLLAPSALLADLALASLGVVLARFYLSNPYLIPLAVAPLLLIQRSFTLLARLGESEERFRTMFEGAPTGTIMVDLDERIVSSNRAFEELVGYTKSELVGRRLGELGAVGDPRAEPFGELLAGERERYVGQLRLLRRDGSDVWGQVAASLVVDAQRRPRFAIVMVEDLTERVHLEEQLRHSQRMEAVGQLAGGIAHDFNNLLTIIAGRTAIALRELGADVAPIRSDLEEIAGAAERAAELTHQLLAYSRRQVLQPRVVDVNAVVAEMDRMLRRLIGEHIEIELDLAADLGRIRADRGQLEQVIANLAVNARDAMEEGGRLTIRTANVEPDEPGSEPHVLLTVRDTGRGMDEPTRSRAFEPFFTTKDPGKGTGLGLSTVYGIIAQSGGRILLDSAPGEGTTVSVYLPAVEEDVSPELEPAPGTGELHGSETLLVAEDDDGVRALAELVLSRYGYRVLGARDGVEALQVADQHAEPIDLLLTDVIMPRMKGPELAEALVAVQPRMRVLYMSGYADAAMLPNAASITVVPKPFSEETLVRLVREALDRPLVASKEALGLSGAAPE
jgi:two-component system, cell cycle sensor histidine kinase and response regulator CckA